MFSTRQLKNRVKSRKDGLIGLGKWYNGCEKEVKENKMENVCGTSR